MPRTITIDMDASEDDWFVVYETLRRAELGIAEPDEDVEIGERKPVVPARGSE